LLAISIISIRQFISFGFALNPSKTAFSSGLNTLASENFSHILCISLIIKVLVGRHMNKVAKRFKDFTPLAISLGTTLNYTP
jgi:hypothetical protein